LIDRGFIGVQQRALVQQLRQPVTAAGTSVSAPSAAVRGR
jgi:hypothetical protein